MNQHNTQSTRSARTMQRFSTRGLLVAGWMLSAPALVMAAGRAQPADAVPPSTPVADATPTATPPADVPMFVRAVEGRVGIITAPGEPITPAKVGQILKPGAEILTAPRSGIQIQVGAGQVFTIDRNSRVKLADVLAKGGTEKTNIELPYGRVTFDVTSTQFSNDVQIKAPDATLAVRGTTGGMAVDGGFPTRSFGGEFNTGRFDVKYDSGVVAKVTGQLDTSGDNPHPADIAQTKTVTDTGSKLARDKDETKRAQSSSSKSASGAQSSDSRELSVLSDRRALWGSPLEGQLFYDVGSNGTSILLRDRFGDFQILAAGLPQLNDPIAGMVVIQDPSNPANRWIVVLQNVSSGGGTTPVLRYVNLGSNSPQWVVLTDFDGSSSFAGPAGGLPSHPQLFLRGLAVVDGNLYSSGRDLAFNAPPNDIGLIYELPTTGATAIARMMLGIDISAITSSGNGTIFAMGSPVYGSAGLGRFILLEVDPVNNFLVNGWSGSNGAFDNTPGTTGSAAGLGVGAINQVTGMTYIGGTLVLTGRTAGGQSITVQYNPAAANTASDPAVQRIEAANALAYGGTAGIGAFLPGGGGAAPSSGIILPPSGPSATTAINPLFAQMGFSTQARLSGVVDSLLREQILAWAADPQQCINSGALGLIPGIASGFDNQSGGFGQSILAFRQSLPQGHPCLPIISVLGGGGGSMPAGGSGSGSGSGAPGCGCVNTPPVGDL